MRCAVASVQQGCRTAVLCAAACALTVQQVIYLSGWAPHESQQKPKARGSATVSTLDPQPSPLNLRIGEAAGMGGGQVSLEDLGKKVEELSAEDDAEGAHGRQ